MVENDLEPIVGDILAKGIVKMGLLKVGANPDTTTADEMKKAIDAHICEAVKSFMGREKATLWAMRIKEMIDRQHGPQGGI